MPTAVLSALVVFVLYVALVGAIWRWKRVDYLHLADTPDHVRDGIVLPIGAGLVLLAVATTVLGWWAPVLTQARTGPAWALVAPVLFGVTALVGTASIDWRSTARSRLPLLAAGVLLVGCAEELLARGILVVGPREAGWAELGVFLFSTILFGLLHGLNGFFGLPPAATLAQIGMAFVGGCALYATRMSTGSLLACALIHALWDFGTLGMGATGVKPRPLNVVLTLLTYLAGIVAVWGILTA